MSFDHQFSLLSLGGGVENLLLSYVSSGDGGLNAILNLRLVCSTTKNWVGNLPPAQAEHIFRHSQANVDLYEEHEIEQTSSLPTHKNPFDVIRQFLENPPPAHIKSLRLSGVEEFAAGNSSPEEAEVWRRFAWFWWRRLESLEVDYFDNLLRPKDSRVNLLLSLSASSLRRLHCWQLEDQKNPLGLPGGLFSIEHLSFYDFMIPSNWTSQFFDSLAKSPKLKSLKLTVWEMENIEDISHFIFLTKNKPNLELTFNFNPGPLSGMPRGNSAPKQLPPYFVFAVADSSASIRIQNLHGTELCGLSEVVGEDAANKFFETVESIKSIELTNPTDDCFLQFPNLKELTLTKNSASEAEHVELLFPPGLKFLSVETGFQKNLPSNLTYLWVTQCDSSVAELMDSLAALDKSCPFLKSLFLFWSGDNNFQVSCACCIEGKISNHQDFKSITPFRNLKGLHFSDNSVSKNSKAIPSTSAFPAQPPDAHVSKNVNGAAWILLNGFKLPQLSLIKLKLEASNKTPRHLPQLSLRKLKLDGYSRHLLDRHALISLIQGNVAKSLVDVEIDGVVAEDALPLKTALEVMAEETAKEHQNHVGPNNYDRWLHAATYFNQL